MTRIRKWLRDNVVELGMFAEWFLTDGFTKSATGSRKNLVNLELGY